MPKRTDIKRILIIGSGPIVIGQACEFDYSGVQACKALKQEGYEIVLVNSNPATIMTDPEFADKTYIEPVTAECIEKIIKKERPDAVLPTLGGQTGLNVACELAEAGVFEKYNVEMLGAKFDAIKKAEDRKLFKQAMEKIGLDLPVSYYAYNIEEAMSAAAKIGYPAIIRASFTLGGKGGGIAYDKAEFEQLARLGIEHSPINEILIEESILGWKEYELEVMRDKADNAVIICSIENLDPMGVHTGDSITVAPALTLSDPEYQKMRSAAIDVLREIGVETGGSNVQFAINPDDGRMVIIEMNPRVSRSSALASKATGFPIAKIAAKLAVGYTLDEIPNDITQKTMACFEPTIDYCVVKIPRFTFEKFPEANPVLGVSMKSVGETMAIGRTFKEAFQKGFRGLEIGRCGFDNKSEKFLSKLDKSMLEYGIKTPKTERLFYIKYALQKGFSIDDIFELSKIDRWFLQNIKDIVDLEDTLVKAEELDYDLLMKAKQYGFGDKQLAQLRQSDEMTIRMLRKALHINPVYKAVDTCGAEFEAYTPYYYSTYETENESIRTDKKKIVILGGGPNRIGQGIEFDYCCCHASFKLKELGYETIMVNSNPETVSTDYDTSDKLYFEPLTFEDVMNIMENENPDGVIVQFGGQTPLSLANELAKAGVPIIGTSVSSIDLAEDRDKFSQVLHGLGLLQTDNGSARSAQDAMAIAKQIGYPVLVRPSYVLGGRAMRIVYDEAGISEFIAEAFDVSPEHPILIDKFLEDAIEIDVDAVCDGKTTIVGGVMEHIEEAGVHSGDSACVIPPHTISEDLINRIKTATYDLAAALSVRGLMNIQFAVKGDDIYVLEVNPRASRTVPFVSKATGQPLAKIASAVMVGKTLEELGAKEIVKKHIAVKESVLPFSRFSGVDIVLGPEMKSTGEVMGIDMNVGTAFYKAQDAAGESLPKSGNIFISVSNELKRDIVFIAKKLSELGLNIYATKGTKKVLENNGIDVKLANKIGEGSPDILDLIKTGKLNLVINMPSGKKSQYDAKPIRSSAVAYGIPCITTLAGAQAAANGIQAVSKKDFEVYSLQELLSV